jgi:hypothetical protein
MLQQPGGRPAPAARRISHADKEELIDVPECGGKIRILNLELGQICQHALNRSQT